MDKSNIDFSRGDEDIVFIHANLDTEELSEAEDPEEKLELEMKDKGLEWENAYLIGLFKDEFSLMLQEDAEIKLDGETVNL
ncbi:MAG: hypothetical protein ACI977_000638 [Candidatus Nanohaloarchaea archaeon]|jgi:hypothetical protein